MRTNRVRPAQSSFQRLYHKETEGSPQGMKGHGSTSKKTEMGLELSEEDAEVEMVDEIEIPEEGPDDNEAEKAEAAKKAAREEERR